jgi:predicted porin
MVGGLSHLLEEGLVTALNPAKILLASRVRKLAAETSASGFAANSNSISFGEQSMKKSLLAVAVFGALASAGAQAQTSVTMFGIVDAAVGRVAASGGASRVGMTTSGINSSRWGVRGTEDLGGGMKAGFWLEAGLNNDTGTTNAAFFNRRSTVSLMGGFGELRLGRDYTPTFWNLTVFDPFGTNGVAGWNSIGLNSGALAAVPNAVRADNTVGYFLPNLGGVYGQVMYGFGNEDLSTAAVKANQYTGLRFGYANGPIDVALSTGSSKVVAGTNNKAQTSNIGASYNFGFAKLMAVYNQNKTGGVTTGEGKSWLIGATAPLGSGEFKFSYSSLDRVAALGDATQIGLGYQHNLSRRTAVYANFAQLSNKTPGTLTLSAQGNLAAPAAVAGGKSTGMEFGLRHSF